MSHLECSQNNMKFNHIVILLPILLYNYIKCVVVAREIIFNKVTNTNKIQENADTVYFIITNTNSYVRTITKENLDNLQSSFVFEYDKDIIKFIIFDTEKFPLNFTESECISEKETNLHEDHKIKFSEIKEFEIFLHKFYLPDFDLSLNSFNTYIYIVELLKIKYDQSSVKIIKSLIFSLQKALNIETDLLKEKILNKLIEKTLSNRMSILIFEIFTAFLFGNQALCNKPRYYSLFYFGIQSILKENFSIKSGNSLYIYENMARDLRLSMKITRIKQNTVIFMIYILNYKKIKIYSLNNKSMLNISIILDLIITVIDNVILYWLRIDNYTLNFINNSSFFRRIQHIYLINPKICNRFGLVSASLKKLSSIVFFENREYHTCIDMDDDFLQFLYAATESEIKEARKLCFDEFESRKELALRPIPNHNIQTIQLLNEVFPKVYFFTVYEYFIYKMYGIIKRKKIADIFYLQIKNSRLKEINSLELFLNYRIRKMNISNSTIYLCILEIIFQFKYLKELTLDDVEIISDKNEELNLKNNTITQFYVQNLNISHMVIYLNIINALENLDELNLCFSNVKTPPKINKIDISHKKTIRIFHININTNQVIDYLYILQPFVITESLTFINNFILEFENNLDHILSPRLNT